MEKDVRELKEEVTYLRKSLQISDMNTVFLQRRISHFEAKEQKHLVNELIDYEREKDTGHRNRQLSKYLSHNFSRKYQY